MSATAEPHTNGQAPWVGRPLRRKEDPPLITGRGTYTDDMVLPGMLYMAIIRSPEAHARIVSVDTEAAKARPGVHAVLTGEDLELESGLPCAWVPPGVEVNMPEHWPLARGTVKHVGDPVAVVVGLDRNAVNDAAEDVLVEYEPLPVVVDVEAALADGAPLVHEQFGTNQAHQWSLGTEPDVLAQAFAEADVVVERRVENHRISGAPIEPRGVVADFRAGELTLYSSTQVPHFLKLFSALILGISEERIRVIAPDVGGGFGAKLQITGEEILLARSRAAPSARSSGSRRARSTCRRPTTAAARWRRCGSGPSADGTITAMHADITADSARTSCSSRRTIASLGAFVMRRLLQGPGRPHGHHGVFTNKVATDAIRGAGGPRRPT
jgi:carbon-monoxide dehydrogenase large subunit